MPDEVVAVSSGRERTYPPPKALREEVLRGVRWARAYNINVPETYQRAAAVLASNGGIGASEIDGIATLAAAVSQHRTGWRPGEQGYPCVERILFNLAGGQEIESWRESIQASLDKQREEENRSLLASVSHDAGAHVYLGVCATSENIVSDLFRTEDGQRFQRWDPVTRDWRGAGIPAGAGVVCPDVQVLAAIVSAVERGDRLRLVHAEPAVFLDERDSVTAVEFPDDVSESVVAAVIDDIDATAVWAAVRIDPGPQVWTRVGGSWVRSQDWPRPGDERPQVVLLPEGDVRTRVLAAVDTVDVGEPVDPPDAIEASMPADTSSQTGPRDLGPVIDGVVARAVSLIGATRDDEDDDEDYESKTERRRGYRAAVADLETVRDWAVTRVRRDLFDAVSDPVTLDLDQVPVVAAIDGKYHPGAMRLRRYWTRGEGALKIRWGTVGDWRRCYRQLFKYLGPRAAGYCQLRHKQTTGMYTGDRRHRAMTAAHRAEYTSGMVALVPSQSDLDRLAVAGGEPRDEIHLTLLFLGEAAPWEQHHRAALVDAVRQAVPDGAGPLTARAFGVAHWNPDSEDPAWVLNVGGSVLEDVAGAVGESVLNLATETGVPEIPEQHSPWQPHITLLYSDMTSVDLSDLTRRLGPVTFDRVRVAFGSEVTDIPLR